MGSLVALLPEKKKKKTCFERLVERYVLPPEILTRLSSQTVFRCLHWASPPLGHRSAYTQLHQPH